MSRQKYTVIGIDDSREGWFAPQVLDAIAAGKVFSGGKRHREIVSRLLPKGSVWIDITVPLEKVYEKYSKYEDIVVFASGDPLFYGFAATLKREMPDAEIVVYPAFNSLQTLAHRILLPYADMRCVSLTGRPWDAFDAALIRGERLIGVLTDRQKTPDMIARRMLDYGYSNYRITVGEALGNRKSEKVRTMTLKEASAAKYEFPNCLILQRTEPRPHPLGLPESEFELLDGRAKMITKMPVRLLSISQLGLENRKSLWDVGFCTGSVSIEAKLQFPHLKVTSFEIRSECEKLLEANARKFGAPGITAVMGDFMEVDLSDLPAPDAVFIGGHGGRLKEMLHRISEVLLPGGVIVFNSVTPESLEMFQAGIAAEGRRIMSRHRLALDEFNPIEILRAE